MEGDPDENQRSNGSSDLLHDSYLGEGRIDYRSQRSEKLARSRFPSEAVKRDSYQKAPKEEKDPFLGQANRNFMGVSQLDGASR